MGVSSDISWLCPGRRAQLSYTPPTDAMFEDASESEAVGSSKTDAGKQAATMSRSSEAELSLQKSSEVTKEQIHKSRSQQAIHDEASEGAEGKEEPGVCSKTIEEASVLAGLPKYTALVVDAIPLTDGRPFKHLCAVFIIPQGMELDWLVSTPEGQAQVVAGADSARVFLVMLNRGYTFESAESVQRELSLWIRKLVPSQGILASLRPGPILYTTPPQGIGHRTVLIESWSEISGPIIVEDVRLAEPGRTEPTTFRRMVFFDTPSLIQSEAVLVSSQQEGAKVSNLNKGEDSGAVGKPLKPKKQLQTTSREDGRSNEDRSAIQEKEPLTKHRVKARKGDQTPKKDWPAAETSKEASLRWNEEVGANDRKRVKRQHEIVTDGAFEAHASWADHERSAPEILEDAQTTEDSIDLRTERRSENLSRSSVDFSCLASEYLQAMVAGLALLGSALDRLQVDKEALEGCNESEARLEDGVLLESRNGDEKAIEGLVQNGGSLESGDESEKLAQQERGVRELTGRCNENGNALRSYDGCEHRKPSNEGGEQAEDGRSVRGRNESGELLDGCNKGGTLLDVLVIGLGGGGLPMFLRHHLPCRVQVVEIDPVVVQLAKMYFGVSEDAAFQIPVADAVQWVNAARELSSSNPLRGTYDAILIDVEAAGGECPPKTFLDAAFLDSLRKLLRPEGVLGMNVVAYEARRRTVSDMIHQAFGGRLYEWSVPRDNNHVLFAQQEDLNRPSATWTAQMPLPPRSNGQDPSSIVTDGRIKPSDTERTERDGEKEEDECDLVYWASRLAEIGAKISPWGQGPNLPGLAMDIRPSDRKSCD